MLLIKEIKNTITLRLVDDKSLSFYSATPGEKPRHPEYSEGSPEIRLSALSRRSFTAFWMTLFSNELIDQESLVFIDFIDAI